MSASRASPKELRSLILRLDAELNDLGGSEQDRKEVLEDLAATAKDLNDEDYLAGENMNTCSVCGRRKVDPMTLNSVGINKNLCYKDKTGSDPRCKVSSTTTSMGDLRVWWIPQIPGSPFHVKVKNIDEAKLLLKTLANYDLFQFKNKIKGDYANSGGLEVFEDTSEDEKVGGEWCEWCNEDGDSIDDVMKKER